MFPASSGEYCAVWLQRFRMYSIIVCYAAPRTVLPALWYYYHCIVSLCCSYVILSYRTNKNAAFLTTFRCVISFRKHYIKRNNNKKCSLVSQTKTLKLSMQSGVLHFSAAFQRFKCLRKVLKCIFNVNNKYFLPFCIFKHEI